MAVTALLPVRARSAELTRTAPAELVVELSQRYIKLYEMITGETFVPPQTDVDVGERIAKNVKDALGEK